VLRELNDDVDRAVFDAYGWNDLAAELVGKPSATAPLPDQPAAQAAFAGANASKRCSTCGCCSARRGQKRLIRRRAPERQAGDPL
jgi:hypothetical protein